MVSKKSEKLLDTRIIKLILYQLVFGKFSDFSQKKDENLQKSRKNPDRCDEKNFTFSI